jgi:hypothetical protein
MADSPRDAATDEVTGTPRWVKVAGIVVLVLVLVFVVLKLTGLGGSHGPGRHAPAADTSRGHTGPPPGVTHGQP